MSGQTAFRDAVLDPARPAPEGLTDGSGRPAGRRFDVYRNNVVVGLTDALVTGFPVLVKLLGEESFRALARHFLRQHPPTSPVLMNYGAELPDFMTNMQSLSHLGYLPDVARLELALRHSYHAEDAAPLAPDALAEIDPERLALCRMSLTPATILLRSRWPIHGIWRFNTVEGAPKPVARGENVLVTRREYDPEPQLLPEGGGLFLSRVIAGDSIGVAYAATLDAAPGFDLAALLSLLIRTGAVATISHEETP